MDDQIKVPRPDGKPDFLGLTVLDEPALRQSDPALLALRLRHSLRTAAGRSSGGGSGGEAVEEAPLGWVPDPADQPAKVEGWCDAVAALHQVLQRGIVAAAAAAGREVSVQLASKVPPS